MAGEGIALMGASGRQELDEIEGFAGLVLRLRREGVADAELLKAVEQSPRSYFVSPAFAGAAFSQRTIPIECGTFLEGADLMVRLLHMLELQKGQRVLEIGTGSGFATSVMARIADRVVSLERYRTLSSLSHQRLEHFGLRNVSLKVADGRNGAPGEGTFDRIFVAGAFETVPRQFVDHLAPNGLMLAGIRKEGGHVVLTRLTRIGNRFERSDGFALPYLPLIPGIAARL
ncbi:protein-L-isoaspartate(D-aspartate) O-methyltransferase [Pararhizobium haloflavum]|uniref:protein-L-isoaspartate(D-aspartate) O-methyltransferase n=1 Tax=Pararhizobium haloflavum TaxID=2037914 RepID=UPI001FE0FAE1|nr:protein-L-isoaspartate(D-aspartate) O-methyltransferase [Pararhizobium haloflavum]